MIIKAVHLLFLSFCFQCLLITEIMNQINRQYGRFGAIFNPSRPNPEQREKK